MRRSGIWIGLLALGAGLLGASALGRAQEVGEHGASSTRSLALEITSRLDAAPAPEASSRAFEASPARPGERPLSRKVSRAMQRAAEEVRRDR